MLLFEAYALVRTHGLMENHTRGKELSDTIVIKVVVFLFIVFSFNSSL